MPRGLFSLGIDMVSDLPMSVPFKRSGQMPVGGLGHDHANKVCIRGWPPVGGPSLMGPGLRVHAMILAVLALAGMAVWLMEWWAVETPGGLFSRYAFTRITWLALGVYALFSSTVILATAALAAWRRRPLRPIAVVLCHVVPVALGALMLQWGVHDGLQGLGSKPPVLSAPPARHRPLPRRPLSPPIAPRLPDEGNPIRSAPLDPVAPESQVPSPTGPGDK